MLRKYTYRWFLSLMMIIAAGSAAIIGCQQTMQPTAPDNTDPSTASLSHHMDWPAAAVITDAALQKELAQVREMTAPFHRVEAATAAGYVPASPHIPSMGTHYGHFGIVDDIFDLKQPEVLVYWIDQATGKHRLVAVEYLVVRPEDAGPPEGFTGDQDHWHLFEEPLPTPDGTEVWAAHVWLWLHNPDGMFREMNSRITP